MEGFISVLRNKKILIVGAGVIFIIVGLGFFLIPRSAVTSPLPYESGVRVIFVTPNPNGLENVAPSAEASASASASPKSTPKISPKSSATATPKATATASPKAAASASPKASPSPSPGTSASPN